MFWVCRLQTVESCIVSLTDMLSDYTWNLKNLTSAIMNGTAKCVLLCIWSTFMHMARTHAINFNHNAFIVVLTVKMSCLTNHRTPFLYWHFPSMTPVYSLHSIYYLFTEYHCSVYLFVGLFFCVCVFVFLVCFFLGLLLPYIELFLLFI